MTPTLKVDLNLNLKNEVGHVGGRAYNFLWKDLEFLPEDRGLSFLEAFTVNLLLILLNIVDEIKDFTGKY